MEAGGMSLRLRIIVLAVLLLMAAVLVTTVLQTLAVVRGIATKTRADGDAMALMLARAAAYAFELPDRVEGEIGGQMLVEARIIAHLVAIAERAGVPDRGLART